ncbi:MAG: sulfite exporter TauE/SafE family protein [Marinicellaceae bacterium]
MLLGTIVGFMAGLLGIGGGGIMVPVLTALFLALEMPIEKVVHLALGTSMASIVITSISSLRAHQKHGAVIWNYVKGMSSGVIVGTFLATYIVSLASSLALAVFFSIFMALIAIKMFINTELTQQQKPTSKKHLFTVGAGIGGISALVSIGGGSLTVPYLVWRNVDIKKAIGTSAAIGLPISLAGTVGYIINGWYNTSAHEFIVGYVYLPAVFLISITSFLFAPIGAKMAHLLPVGILKKIFAVLLIGLSLKMLVSII